MEMRASQVIKGALGGGAKRKKVKDWGEKQRERRRREERRETPSNPHRQGGVETGMSQLFSDSSGTSVRHCRFDLFELRGRCRFLQITPGIFIQRQQEVIFGLLVADWLKSTNRSSDIR